MHIIKQKDFSNIPLVELKEDLNIFSGDTSYDNQIIRYYKSAVYHIENLCGIEIVPTTCEMTDYDICGSEYLLRDVANEVLSISATTSTGIVTQITDFTFQKYYQYTILKFDERVNTDALTIEYQTGFNEIPFDLQRAINIVTAQYFDVDRNGYITGSIKESNAVQRIVNNYKNLIY